jgi:hypothetical protein
MGSFASVTDAVRCAIEIQGRVAERNREAADPGGPLPRLSGIEGI